MAGTSVTGKGPGDSGKLTTDQLAIFANGPSILIAGTVEVDSGLSSPPASGMGTVVFPKVLPGPVDDYVVILTGIGTGAVQVVVKNENGLGEFIGFTATAEDEGTAMYIVSKIGVRA